MCATLHNKYTPKRNFGQEKNAIFVYFLNFLEKTLFIFYKNVIMFCGLCQALKNSQFHQYNSVVHLAQNGTDCEFYNN